MGVSAVLEFADVTFHRESNQILRDINWSVDEGQHWIIVGPNGAGKSTLMSIAGARLYPSSGYASVLGEILGLTDVFDLRQRIGLASSSMAQLIDDEETVLNAVRTAAYAMSGSWQETYDDEDNERALKLLADWNLDHAIKRRWITLSEGEKKRLLIARAMMSDPEVLMLDEPAAGLDDRRMERRLLPGEPRRTLQAFDRRLGAAAVHVEPCARQPAAALGLLDALHDS